MSRYAPVPTNAELLLLRILWRRGPQTVREVHRAVRRERDIGYTTVLKTLQVMAEKGLVTRDESARSHVYAAALGEATVKRRAVKDLLVRVFDGSAEGLVMQALSSRRASAEELARLRALIDELRRRAR
ncbi:MAG TPA: BlaI/MecI/CopY family transcriptional regulator [Gemmatimonadaceae bacterium]|nr:BlaI/MecI/CopY family transcriptional regulator [Gemmatimonadaceae bacterium]